MSGESRGGEALGVGGERADASGGEGRPSRLSVRAELVDGAVTFAECVVESAGGDRLFGSEPIPVGKFAGTAGDVEAVRDVAIERGEIARRLLGAGPAVSWTVDVERVPAAAAGWCGSVTVVSLLRAG